MQNLINSTYEHVLAYHFHQIDNRGLLIDHKKHANLKQETHKELAQYCIDLSLIWGLPVYAGSENNPKADVSLNINSPAKLLDRLKDLGYKVPKVRQKNEDTGDYEYEDSANKLAIKQLLADPGLWPNITDAGKAIKILLDAKEVITFRNRYVNAKLYNNQYFASHSVTSTVTGRRGSKKNIFGFGGNDQNFPARGRLSSLWKESIIARPGKIFLFVDQMQAEDWPVQALAQNQSALEEMRKGVNRHYIFANKIFGTPIDELKKIRGDKSHKDFLAIEMQYNLGKRGRHANNYGMQPARLSEILAAEGYSIPVSSTTSGIVTTKWILETINKIDPNVKGIFHKYVQEELSKSSHRIRTPLGRERQFFGLRSGEKNYNIFNEAYSYIPQSTVGDNTGLAVAYLESCGCYADNSTGITQDGHDSLCQELCDTEEELIRVFEATKAAFDRDITFDNGITIHIPIEAKLGYDWFHQVTVNDKAWDYTVDNLLKANKELKEKYGRTTS